MAAPALRTRDDGAEDELPFGDFCFNCGNATQGTPYCSADCRKADLERSEASPDFSPSLSAVPPLVPSAKSVCSTPPSSATNSPSPPSGLVADLDDPPALDLPPPKHGFGYGQSLPNVAMRFPSTWTINYQPDPLASPLVAPTEVPLAKDISFRRKANRPQSAVPSPLYFRQKAAAVHSSPAFGPTSPAARLVPLHPHVDYSGAHVHEDDIAVLDLPGRQDTISAPPFVPTPAHCGRPGCVGVPARPKIDTSVAGVTSTGGRRQSWQGNGGFRGLTPIEGQTEDVLMSPRIRALRTGRSQAEENKAPASPQSSDADDAHSAFACYLFSHLSAEPAPERGRSASIDHGVPDVPRSLSVDAAMASRPAAAAAVTASGTASPARPVRPIRGMLGGRGPAPQPLHRSDPALQPLTPALPTDGESSASPASSRGRSDRNHDRDATIRPPVDRRGRSERMKLVPGHFISATTESPSTSASPFPSPPPSPPTAGRGRSSTRRLSNSASMMDDMAVASPDPRGRSKLRGLGAVKRSMSPSARKESLSRSPSPNRSRSRSRTQTRGNSRTSYSRGRGGRDGPERASSPRRGRTRERTVEEDVEAEADVEEEEEVEERGRGRMRGSRSRSRSLLARGRGREVVYSMAAYGHCDSSDESDRGR
ncbi:hypothetical protein JCM6882_009613 [Rhodosporidiobolus microsporus]